MYPNEGYILHSSNSGSLIYPFSIGTAQLENLNQQLSESAKTLDGGPDWSVNVSDYSGSMTLTGQVTIFDSTNISPLNMAGAFLNGECRGVTVPQYVEPLDQYFIFMTIYGNEEDHGDLVFHIYNESTDEILFSSQLVEFETNGMVGTLSEPYTLDASSLTVYDPGYIPGVFSLSQNYPNPFNPVTTIAYGIPQSSAVRITVYNMLGEEVATIENQVLDAGYYFTTWNGQDNLGNAVSAGVYLYQIEAGDFTKTRKLILLK